MASIYITTDHVEELGYSSIREEAKERGSCSVIMGLSSAVLFIFLSLLIQSRANQEVKGQSKDFVELNPSPFPGQSKDFLLCDGVKVSGISRLKLGMFVSAYRVTVVPSVAIPERLHSKILVCFHRNNALGLCQCKKDEWKAIQKGRWSSVMSPYEDRYVDVKFIDGVKGSVSVTLDEDSQQWRLFFLALGFVLLLLAPIHSWVPFYYTSSMDIGVFHVILIILFQGTLDIPLALGAVVSCWTLCSLINSLKFGGLRKFFISEDGSVDVGVSQFVKWAMRIIGTTSILQCTLHTPLALEALVACWTLCPLIHFLKPGGVMEFTISVDGSVHAGVAQFVKWAMRIIGTMLILQCTLDTPLALGAVVACWTLCSLIHALMSGGVRYQTFGFHNISLRTNEQDMSRRTRAEFKFLSGSSEQLARLLWTSNSRLDEFLSGSSAQPARLLWTSNSRLDEFLSGSSAQPGRVLWSSNSRLDEFLSGSSAQPARVLWSSNSRLDELLSRSSAQAARMLRSSNRHLAWSDSPLQVNAGMNRSSSGMQNQQEYYSTFHALRNRKKFTKKEWDGFTRESLREALAEWAASLECTDRIIESLADRLQRIKVRQEEMMQSNRELIQSNREMMEYLRGMMDYQRETRCIIQNWMGVDEDELAPRSDDEDP